ncbi:MAG: alpha-ketoacid dehydrogenase subunit alpha/beta [Gemmatimonadota bacterium]
MATSVEETGTRDDVSELSSEDILELYRTMLTARRVDDREIRMKQQNRIFFQVSGAGHEAAQVAAAAHLRPGYDWFFLYYRDRALSLALGQTPGEHFLQAVGAHDDPHSGGRQMPSHWSSVDLNIPTPSSPTGTQFLQAVGAAEAGHRMKLLHEARDRIGEYHEDAVVLVCGGDGTTSEGEFWEALNTACNLRLPVVFLVEDNQYAISVPVEVQTPGGSISRLVQSFPNLLIREYDGTDLRESWEAAGEAVRYAREGRGPALLHAHVVRLYSHSMSDDERLYKTDAEREAEAERDPLARTRRLILDEGFASEEELSTLEAEVEETVANAAEEAASHPQPEPDTATDHLYATERAPTSAEFDTEESPDYPEEAEPTTMVDLLNACLRDELEHDPRVLVFGEDVADVSREEIIDQVKGKGGVFKVTAGLQRRFGGHRVFNTPLAEANIVGRAVGLALRGFKPVVEIQFFDYIWPAFHQIRNEVATMRYRSAGAWSASMVIRATYGGYLRGGSIYHSQTGASIFAHSPGLRVVLPATAEDAIGLLRTAIRCDDPVLFLEHKHLYRQIYNKGRYPGKDFMIPFGKAKVIREGSDVTLVTCGALVKRSLDAVKALEKEKGVSVEVIDLRTISPLDMDTVADSVRKTNRALVVHEDARSFGFGAEIAARISDELFAWLDAPVRRVASLDTWVAYSPRLEEAILPQASDVRAAIEEICDY